MLQSTTPTFCFRAGATSPAGAPNLPAKVSDLCAGRPQEWRTGIMLVSALMGLETMKRAYAHAIQNGYRFYSYGDSSLLLPR